MYQNPYQTQQYMQPQYVQPQVYGQQQYVQPQYVQPQVYQQPYGQQPYVQPAPTTGTLPGSVAAHVNTIVQTIMQKLHAFLAMSTQRKTYAESVLQNQCNNPKFNSLVMDIAEYLDYQLAMGQQPFNDLAASIEHFLTLDACLFVTKHQQLLAGASQEQINQVYESANKFNAIISALDQRFGRMNGQPLYGQAQPYQQQPYQQPGYVQPQVYGQQPVYQQPVYGQPQYMQPQYNAGVPGHMNNYVQQPVVTSAGTYRGDTGVEGTYQFIENNAEYIPLNQPQQQQPTEQYVQQPTQQPVQQPYQPGVRNGVLIDEITIPPTGQPTYNNHAREEVQRIVENTMIDPNNPSMVLHTTVQFLQHYRKTRRIPKAFDFTKAFPVLNISNDNVEELLAEINTKSELQKQGLNMEYADFETEKLVKPLTEQEKLRPVNTENAKRVLSNTGLNPSIEEMLSKIEEEAGEASGGEFKFDPKAMMTLGKAIFTSAGAAADPYSELASRLRDLNLPETISVMDDIDAPLLFTLVEHKNFVFEDDGISAKVRKCKSHRDLTDLVNDLQNSLPLLQFSQLCMALTDGINYLLKAELDLDLTIDSYILDNKDLEQHIANKYGEAAHYSYQYLVPKLVGRALNIISKTELDTLCGIGAHLDEESTGSVLASIIPHAYLPIHAADLALAFAGNRGKITTVQTPELNNLVTAMLKANDKVPGTITDMRIITKDARIIKLYITTDGDRVIIR